MILEIFFSIFIISYCLLLMYLTYGWINKKVVSNINKSNNVFSIVISVRNEAENIDKLINSIANLDYPLDSFETIIIDDFSTDNTVDIIKNHSYYSKINLIFNSGIGKKDAITVGIEASKYDYVACTDGDCTLPRLWLQNFNNEINSTGSKFVSGPVIYEDSSFLNYEFLGLIGIGGSSLNLGFPTMANGANLCFKKQAFFQVEGYKSSNDIASGDDEFLLHKITKKYPKKVSFIKEYSSIVSTKAPNSINEFFNQRIRWSSKWKNYKSKKNSLPSIFIFLLYLMLVGYLFVNSFDKFFTILIVAKVISEIIFMFSILSFFKKREWILYSLLSQIYYPIYILIIGIRTLSSETYNWKERKTK